MKVTLLLGNQDLTLTLMVKPRLVLVVLELHEFLGELKLHISYAASLLNRDDFLIYITEVLYAFMLFFLLPTHCNLCYLENL